jgi:hypothetical protein
VNHTLGVFCLAALALAVGCGKQSQAIRVGGEVSFDGKPVEEGNIAFLPVQNGNVAMTGGQIVNGKYDIPASRGLRIGQTYRVEITGLRKTGRKVVNGFDPKKLPLEAKEEFIPAAYNRHSQLTLTVASSGDNKHDFQLTATGR